MKRSVSFIIGIIAVIAIVVLFNNTDRKGLFTAGGGISLKEMNDTTKLNFVAFAEANATTSEQLAQLTAIANWEHQYNRFFVGADIVGTASTQFGVMCPTLDFRIGTDFSNCRLEAKIGNFTRNNVKTAGFDPQFMNFLILQGEAASVSNAVQLSYINSYGTRVMLGHQGGDKFYTFNGGNYYLCAEQTIKNVSVSGGVDFTEHPTGYAAVKWAFKDNTLAVTGNKLSSEKQNLVLSYVRQNICRFKNGARMSFGSAVWGQKDQHGIRLVTGYNKGRLNLFAEAGGIMMNQTFSPLGGLGISYKL